MLKPLVDHALWFVNVGWFFQRRATSRRLRDEVFFVFEGRSITYGETWTQAVRYAGWFDAVRRRRLGAGTLPGSGRLGVGIYQENSPEFVYAFFGAALSGAVLFGLNTGLGGPTLATLIDQAELGLVLTEASLAPELRRIQGDLASIGAEDIVETDRAGPGGVEAAIAAAEISAGQAFERPPKVRVGNFDPLVVIYTSGTTGAPKGVVCTHLMLVGVGLVTARRVGLRRDDRGYICMPMFHSNAWFLGVMPMLFVGGSFVLKRRFSASAFEDDLLAWGPTYMNYVGQPIHYILSALEVRHGGGEAVTAALAKDPRNRFRVAHGNGATPSDRDKLVRYLGMDHVYELYGSTEAAISTVFEPGDPPGSLGRLKANARILDEAGDECPPAEVDEQGRITNYDRAVGEIVARVKRNNVFFHGYHNNRDATDGKFRDGWFRSGDLGHVRIVGGRRYLYFDGENFSAENVARFAQEHADFAIAVAYGAPHPVADEAVMIAVQLRPDTPFDPQATFDRFEAQCRTGGMDRKWFPDFVRVVEAFETTSTQKVLVRALKRRHFGVDGPGDRVWFRERGDSTYRPLTSEDLGAIRDRFAANGRGALLER